MGKISIKSEMVIQEAVVELAWNDHEHIFLKVKYK